MVIPGLSQSTPSIDSHDMHFPMRLVVSISFARGAFSSTRTLYSPKAQAQSSFEVGGGASMEALRANAIEEVVENEPSIA